MESSLRATDSASAALDSSGAEPRMTRTPGDAA
jgi:hypothetical protein